MSKQLNERVTMTTVENADRESGVIKRVKVLGHKSVNKTMGRRRRYSNAAMKNGIELFDNLAVNVDHVFGEPRSARDRLGKFVNPVVVDDDGIYADLHVLTSHEMVGPLFDAATDPKLSDTLGFSIDATGEGEIMGEEFVVTVFDDVASADLVADPATVNGLYEGRDPPGDSDMELKELKLDDLRVARPDLVKDLIAEGVSSRDDEVKDLTEERDALKVKVDAHETAERNATAKADARKLAENKLGKDNVTDTFVDALVACDDDDARDALIEDRKAIVGKGKPRSSERVTETDGGDDDGKKPTNVTEATKELAESLGV